MPILSGPRSLLDWSGADRVTLAIVFTDIVGSTALGVELGDQRMNEVRNAHFRHSEGLIDRYVGRQVKTIGDSVMAVFRSAGAAFDYACALYWDPGADELRERGVRAGIHIGAVDVHESDIFGTEVAFAARVTHAIEGAEIWLSNRAWEDIDRAGARHQRGLEWEQHGGVELKGLGSYLLWSLVPNEASRPAPAPPPAARAALSQPEPVQPASARVAPRPAGNGRTVFVARPADDMRVPYARVLDELTNRGFTVVPESDIPSEEGSAAFVDAALSVAELSVHLLGEKRGYAPAEEDPIVKLQLARAQRRADAGAADGAPEFRRIVWAPISLDDPEAPQSAAAAQRDPLAVLGRFGEQIASDKVLGENLIRFIEFLRQHLDKTRPRALVLPPDLPAGTKIFINHAEDDCDYALDLADALQERSLIPLIPTLEGKPALRAAQNRKLMQECSAVALCWGSATEAWVMAEASKLEQWRRAGRQDSLVATLLAGPPGGRFKERRLRIKPPGIDKVVDMTAIETLSPEDLDPWLGPAMGGDD